jgi:hypothetical protein
VSGGAWRGGHLGQAVYLSGPWRRRGPGDSLSPMAVGNSGEPAGDRSWGQREGGSAVPALAKV